MSEWNAAYYGSGLKLNEEEFINFFKQYLACNPKEMEKALEYSGEEFDPGAAYEPDEAFDLTTEAYSDCGYIPSDLSGTEVTMDPKSEERFGIVRISDDDIYDGMRFMPYRVNDKFNVPHNMKNGAETENPEFVDWIDLRAETSYMIFCEIPLDGPMSFVKRPYDSYEDFVNEFRHKMERYLPKDFDWDAHLGRFNYSAYC